MALPLLCSFRTTEWLSSAAWVIIYLLLSLAVGAGVMWPTVSWFCSVAFLCALCSVVFHIVRAVSSP